MPTWNNQPLTVYHGTDSGSLPSGWGASVTPFAFSVDVTRCQRLTDFGRGFYTTTNEHQAEQWANTRVIRKFTIPGLKAVVLAFHVDRDALAKLDTLTFVRPTRDFWDLVSHCRTGLGPHGRKTEGGTAYDVVYGRVTLWPQFLTITDCDQISFHTAGASLQVNAAGAVRIFAR